jgi:pimeloyl-ACP methyl ester carboxylesterase
MGNATCVLVHGGWHGGWHWDDVASRLRAAGLRVYAPTLRGLGQRSAEASETTCIADHVADVVEVIDRNDLRDVVLVGHSYGGAVVTGAAHKRGDRVAHVVYLDAFVPRHGQSLADIFGPDFEANARAQARAAGTPYLVPPAFSMEDVLGVGPEEAAAHAAKLSPHPLGTMLDAVDASSPISAARSYICCTERSLGMFETYAKHARESADWNYYELPSPHDAVYAMPAVVAGIIQHIACGKAAPRAPDHRGALIAADRAFFDALIAGDTKALDAALADDFVIVDIVAGGVTQRAAFIEGVASRAVAFESIATAPDEALVRVHDDTGIVVGRTEMHLTVPGTGAVHVRSRYTHVFRRSGSGEWQLMSAQGTQIA